MIITKSEPFTKEEIEQAAEDLEGYIKFVVDLERKVMTIGGARHVEGEEILLSDGSKQSDLWGGGYDSETGDIDYDSMINIRPAQGNSSREVLDNDIRQKMLELVTERLGL